MRAIVEGLRKLHHRRLLLVAAKEGAPSEVSFTQLLVSAKSENAT